MRYSMISFLCAVVGLSVSLSTPAQAKDLTLAVGLSLPPYIFKDEDRGIEFDIVATALKKKGHSLKATYIPFGKVPEYVSSNKVDGAMTVNEASGIQGHFSDYHITYQNFAITLAEKGLSINSIADLSDKTIAAFQNATLYLGDDFKTMAANNKSYTEIALQVSQVLALYRGFKQVVVSDVNIFKFYRQQTADQNRADVSADVTYHAIFEPTSYKVIFNDEAVRNDFNAALKEMRDSGEYDAIVAKYIKE